MWLLPFARAFKLQDSLDDVKDVTKKFITVALHVCDVSILIYDSCVCVAYQHIYRSIGMAGFSRTQEVTGVVDTSTSTFGWSRCLAMSA